MSSQPPVNVLTATASYFSGYLPETLKDAAGLSPQISEDVRHITWLSIERVFWPQDTVRLFLVLGYQDGFQVYDVQDPATGQFAHEVLSKQASNVCLARLLHSPLVNDEEDAKQLGAVETPMLAYLDRGAPARVRLFSMRKHDDCLFLRLTEPARSLQASRRYFAVGLQCLVELYDSLKFEKVFSVECAGTCPTFALGHRWLAYNMPPQPANASAGNFLTGGGTGARLPSMVREGLHYVKQATQRTFDNMFMPPPEGGEVANAPAKEHCGIVEVRDAASKQAPVIAKFNDHVEPIEIMAWDPSGLQLVSGAASGHCVLVHRALIGSDVQSEFALGNVIFQHLYTLYRGCTPAVMSDIIVSEDGQEVAISSAKGTTHVFRLPPLHSVALGHYLGETGAVHLPTSGVSRSSGLDDSGSLGINIISSGAVPSKPITVNAITRVKLGSMFVAEGLMPQCGFINCLQNREMARNGRSPSVQICVASRVGTLSLYTLNPSVGEAANSGSVGTRDVAAASPSDQGEWKASLTKEIKVWRPFRHFRENRFSQNGMSLMCPPQQSSSSSSTAVADPWPSPLLLPRASPRHGPSPNPSSSRASPRLGVTASPLLVPSASPRLVPSASPRLGESSAIRAASPPRVGSPETQDVDPSKWLSQVETATHLPMDIPIWHCPQLSFHTYPASTSAADLNASLRSGEHISSCKELIICRPERPSERVHYDGVSIANADRLSELFVGALQSTVDDTHSERDGVPLRTSDLSVPEAATTRTPALVVAPAWGAIGEQQGGSLEQENGIGSGLDDLEEEWLKA